MLPQTSRRRAGMSLIELLVVMAIIATLTSLLMAAVQRARLAGLRTDNGARITQVGEAIGRIKTDLKLSYIPSHPINTTVPTTLYPNRAPGTPPHGFALKGKYEGNEPELEILLRAFPNMNTVARQRLETGNPSLTTAQAQDNGYTGPDVVLDANQTLCFFLTGGGATNLSGFSNNPRKPFTAASAGEQRKGPWLQNNPKYYKLTPPLNPGGTPAAPDQPSIIDAYGNPYAYFASVNGKLNNYYRIPVTPATTPPTFESGEKFSFTGPKGASGDVYPYERSDSTAANLKFQQENGFQIISAGYDEKFGGGKTLLPATGDGADDQSNFSKSLLGGGIN